MRKGDFFQRTNNLFYSCENGVRSLSIICYYFISRIPLVPDTIVLSFLKTKTTTKTFIGIFSDNETALLVRLLKGKLLSNLKDFLYKSYGRYLKNTYKVLHIHTSKRTLRTCLRGQARSSSQSVTFHPTLMANLPQESSWMNP